MAQQTYPAAPFGQPANPYGAPGTPYGPPPGGPGYGYQPPQPPQPPKKNTGKIVGGIIGALVLIGGAVVGAIVLFSPKYLDAAKLQDLIASSTKDAGAEATGISCPTDIEPQKGGTFTCTATVDGQQVTYTVTQTDDKGQVQVNSDGRFVPVADVEARVSDKVSADAGVDVQTSCEAGGHTTLVVTDSTDLQCTVTNAEDASDSAQVTATVDGEGNVTTAYDQ
jgi:hypothetical protein